MPYIEPVSSLLSWCGSLRTLGTFSVNQQRQFLSNPLSITIGYHRLYSHRAFRANTAVRTVLAALGSAGFQGSIKVGRPSTPSIICIDAHLVVVRRSLNRMRSNFYSVGFKGVSDIGYIMYVGESLSEFICSHRRTLEVYG